MMIALLLLVNISFGLTSASSEPSYLELEGSDGSSQMSHESACPEEDSSIPPKADWYPLYHLAPPGGWMNDPNGLIEYNGWYHAFYQHNPHDTEPRQIHWGHARSKDLLRWEHLPIALAPETPEDEGGCFSGSAVDNNGTLTLMYTGNGKVQVQCLATSDDKEGIHFTKHGKVLDPPPGVVDFRDPKVFRTHGSWFVVVGTSVNGSGKVLLYKSPDLYQWESQGVLADGDPGGYMWECPDFFPLEDKHVLLFSPQGIPPEGYLYRNLYQNGYLMGTWSPGESFLIEQPFTLLDRGQDFYAPQTFLTSDGRRIAISWLDMWETTPMPEKRQGWAGMLSLPREITLGEHGLLVQSPIREVEGLRSIPDGIRSAGATLDSSHLELASEVRAAEVTTSWNITASDAEKYGLHLGRHDSSSGLFLYVDGQAGRVVLDRRYPQFGVTGSRSIPLQEGAIVVNLRAFFDHSSVEVFVGGMTLSSRIYPHERMLCAYAENGKAELLESVLWVLETRDG